MAIQKARHHSKRKRKRMNPPSLTGFRTSLLNRVRVADREIIRAKRQRKNIRAELDKIQAMQALVFLDNYIERASDE